MDGGQQTSILNAFVWVVIIVAVIIGGIFVYNNYSTTSPVVDTTNGGNTSMATSTMTLRSSAFQPNTAIPSNYTCDGNNGSPPLSWSGAPAETQSFVLIMDDPDVPKQLKPDGVFDHWVLFNIPATTTMVAGRSTVGVSGKTGGGKNEYVGPCPPPQYEPSEHRYFFRLYALDSLLSLSEGASKTDVLQAMQGHILGEAELMGKYKRQQ